MATPSVRMYVFVYLSVSRQTENRRTVGGGWRQVRTGNRQQTDGRTGLAEKPVKTHRRQTTDGRTELIFDTPKKATDGRGEILKKTNY